MAANISPIFPFVVQTSALSIVNADSTTEKTLVTAGTDGTRIDTISASSTDTVARTIAVKVYDGAVSYTVGEVPIPAGSGTNGSAVAVKVLSAEYLPWLDSSGSLFLKAGWSLRVAVTAAVTADKTITLVAFAGDY